MPRHVRGYAGKNPCDFNESRPSTSQTPTRGRGRGKNGGKAYLEKARGRTWNVRPLITGILGGISQCQNLYELS
jgi:hypothetical protein